MHFKSVNRRCAANWGRYRKSAVLFRANYYNKENKKRLYGRFFRVNSAKMSENKVKLRNIGLTF